jgi:hypothetical protein
MLFQGYCLTNLFDPLVLLATHHIGVKMEGETHISDRFHGLGQDIVRADVMISSLGIPVGSHCIEVE